jgi:hypothetical protein
MTAADTSTRLFEPFPFTNREFAADTAKAGKDTSRTIARWNTCTMYKF